MPQFTIHNPQSGIQASRWTIFSVCIFLALIVWIVFGQTAWFDFTNYDDSTYVYKDSVVTRGLTLPGLAAAFSDRHSDNWVPLTTLSHMLDCQLYGLNAGGHHLTNVILQTAASILLFLALRQMTGFLWRSAFVAAVFAIHPLRVESVAWISERKDVLCGVFFTLTLWAYVRFVRSLSSSSSLAAHWSGLSRQTAAPASEGVVLKPEPFNLKPFIGWYLATLFCFILALLSKPSVVMLPFVLLLLDYWPLQRFNSSTLQPSNPLTFPRLILEKVPLLLLSLASCIPTLIAEKTGIQPLNNLSLQLRIENAIVSYVIQIERMVYPAHLAAFYPYPRTIPWWDVTLAGTLLAGICVLAWTQRRARPWLLVGWLWYLGMLFPNIGIIQVGAQAQADRHTYLPQIGLYLALTWTAAELSALWCYRRSAAIRPLPANPSPAEPDESSTGKSEYLAKWFLGSLSTIILLALIFCAHTQAASWRNSDSLWTHTLACTSGNFFAHNNLGTLLVQQGNLDGAISNFQTALHINPSYVPARYNLGAALLRKGKVDEAISNLQQALQIKPDLAYAGNDLGNELVRKDDLNRLHARFQQLGYAYHDLGNALLRKGDLNQAVIYFQRALQINPDEPKFRGDLVVALNNLAWSLATSPDATNRDGMRAVQLGGQACQLTEYQQTVPLGTLAAAYAEAGLFDDAVATAQKAITNAQRQRETKLAQKNQQLLQLYQAHQPYHEPKK